MAIISRFLEKKSDLFYSISKYVYLSIFAFTPVAVYYMLEVLGAYGVPSIAFSFLCLFIVNLYYNPKLVLSYSAATIILYTCAILFFPNEFFGGNGKNAVGWTAFGLSFIISTYISTLLSKRLSKMIEEIENEKNESNMI